jgi:hypothetical protein
MEGTSTATPFHMEREVRPLSRNPNFQSTIAVYIFWKVGKQFKKNKKSLPTDPNFEDHEIGNTHIFFFGLSMLRGENKWDYT